MDTAVQQAVKAMRAVTSEVNYDVSTRVLRLHALHVVAHLPAILETLHQNGLTAGEINVRANTLEDVFIQLTGRSLRE